MFGDILAGLIASSVILMRALLPGPSIATEGCETFVDMEAFSVMGLVEILKHLPRLLKNSQNIIQTMLQENSDVYIGEAAHEKRRIWFVPEAWWRCIINTHPEISKRSTLENNVLPRNESFVFVRRFPLAHFRQLAISPQAHRLLQSYQSFICTRFTRSEMMQKHFIGNRL